MSDMPRHHWMACDLDGARVGGSALSLCAYLWTYLPARQDEQGQRLGGFVFHTAERLATELVVDKRTIERQLRQLRSAGLIRPACDQQKRPGFCLMVLPGSAGIADRSGGGSPIVLSEIADRSGGDRRSILSGSPIVLSEIADRSGSRKEEQDREQDREQEREQDLGLARSLAASALVPDGAPPIGKTRPALRALLALLADGEEPATIERVLKRAADIVARGLEAAAYFGPDMFRGSVWTHWCRSLFELERIEQAEAAQRERQAGAAEAAEAQRREQAAQAARDAAASLCSRIRRAQGSEPNSLSALLAESDPFEAALIYAPELAVEAMDRARELAGDSLTEADVVAAVVALGVKPPTRKEMTPADLRAARERAEREGRDVFDVLGEASTMRADNSCGAVSAPRI